MYSGKKYMINLVKISKKISYVLRHAPESIGVELGDGGWCGIKELIDGIGISREDLLEVVGKDEKKRYEINGERIRASQGHSVEVELGYSEIEPPEYLYHGTNEGVIEKIKLEGIKKMGRHHVHLSEEIETAKRVGGRRGKVIILEIRAGEMYLGGEKFYKSTNGVWLVEYVSPEHIKWIN